MHPRFSMSKAKLAVFFEPPVNFGDIVKITVPSAVEKLRQPSPTKSAVGKMQI
jgi:hypothetical protein